MRYYESETIELKEKYVSDIKKEIVAFANTIGGVIYVGISNTGEVVGVESADFVTALEICCKIGRASCRERV